jgi:hypothetical protein
MNGLSKTVAEEDGRALQKGKFKGYKGYYGDVEFKKGKDKSKKGYKGYYGDVEFKKGKDKGYKGYYGDVEFKKGKKGMKRN